MARNFKKKKKLEGNFQHLLRASYVPSNMTSVFKHYSHLTVIERL